MKFDFGPFLLLAYFHFYVSSLVNAIIILDQAVVEKLPFFISSSTRHGQNVVILTLLLIQNLYGTSIKELHLYTLNQMNAALIH